MSRERLCIAVVGAGISGLGAAWLLSRHHDVVLLEAADRLGGHARTVTVRTGNRDVPVDTGFIVFNKVNYPNLCRLFERLEVTMGKSGMSFAVSVDDGMIEYGSRNLRSAVAQPANLANPAFWRMFRDIALFNRTALEDTARTPDMTLGDLIRRRRFGSWFEQNYLLPMSGAIWSTPRADMLDFPALHLVRFFANHGLLTFRNHHQWWTVEGGSRNYVRKLAADMDAEVRLRAPVESVTRRPDGVQVKVAGQESESFDRVIFACHSDSVLGMLKDATAAERRVLGGIRYRKNRIVLHTDTRLMPKRKTCWSSWVYLARSQPRESQASVTYWMNSLQNIPCDTQIFATLNPLMPINEIHILDEHPFEHPQFDAAAFSAQAKLPSVQGRDNTWFCGSWTGMGFHEDGLASAVGVARQLGAPPPWN